MCIWPRCEQIETKKTCLHVAYLHWIIGFTIVLRADHVRQLYWNAEHGVLVRCWLRTEFVRFGSSQHGSCIAIYHIYSLLNTFYTINYTVNGKGIFARNEKFTRAIFSVNVFIFYCKIIHAMKMGEVKWKTIHQWCNCILLCMHFLLLHLMDNQSIAINDTAILSLCQRNNNHAAFDAHRHYQVGDWTCKYELNVQHVNVVFCIYLICCIDCAIGDTRSTL